MNTCTGPGRGDIYQDFLFVDSLLQVNQREHLEVLLTDEITYGCGNYTSYTQGSSIEKWRQRVAEWAFNVIDFYSLNRETASEY